MLLIYVLFPKFIFYGSIVFVYFKLLDLLLLNYQANKPILNKSICQNYKNSSLTISVIHSPWKWAYVEPQIWEIQSKKNVKKFWQVPERRFEILHLKAARTVSTRQWITSAKRKTTTKPSENGRTAQLAPRWLCFRGFFIGRLESR